MKDRMRSNPFVPAVLLLCLFALLICGTSCTAEAAKKKTETKSLQKAQEKKTDFKIIAYYFHGNFRCVTCRKLEALADEAIKTGFPQELKDGAIEWRGVNVEEKVNEHFIQDYKLYSKSIVLVEMKGDKQEKWKNLEKIWDLVKDKDTYIKYVQEEVKLYLSDAPKKPEKKEKKKDSK